MKFLVATNNQGKLKEFNQILGELGIQCVSLKDMGISVDVEETGTTFMENALLKAKEIYKIAKLPTISDDSGLMVDALSGEPGVYSARYAESTFDHHSTFILFMLYSMPVMWVGLLLQSAFCSGGMLPVFPLRGVYTPPVEMSTFKAMAMELYYYALPALCLAYGSLAGLARYTRSNMLEVLNSDYIRTAYAKGLSASSVIWKHAFRNTLITLITLFSGLLPSLVAGSIIVEHIFNIPGMGTLSLLSLSSRDYPLQMALFTFSGMLTLLGIFTADLLYTAADPRIKLD